MFAAAAVNNIIAVTGGIERYFDAADVPDATVLIQSSRENDLEEKIEELARGLYKNEEKRRAAAGSIQEQMRDMLPSLPCRERSLRFKKLMTA